MAKINQIESLLVTTPAEGAILGFHNAVVIRAAGYSKSILSMLPGFSLTVLSESNA
jgi:hypothetical protein